MGELKPLLKWPGGKRTIAAMLKEQIPTNYNRYHELFLGGGALFFKHQPVHATINDLNEDLMNFYTVVKNEPENLIETIQSPYYVNTLENYMFIRSLDRNLTMFNSLTEVQKAARFLFLNRAGFNGLYRVNKANQSNVHYGHKPNIVYDFGSIRKVHSFFKTHDTVITSTSFVDAANNVTGVNNFVYLDPPYLPLTEKSKSFTAYTAAGFKDTDHMMVKTVAEELDGKRNFVLLSNHDSPRVRELYKNFVIQPIQVQRAIGASAATRVKAGEVLILGQHLYETLKQQNKV